jgi:para-nitrobenzyl esterase
MSDASAFSDFPAVRCPAGVFRGISTGGVDRFAGIPYALPPVGALRFMPAVPLVPGALEHDAKQFGPASAQVFDPLEGAIEEYGEADTGKAWVGSEDSLTLNIWRPARRDCTCPVVIWIHGGANWLESSRFSLYDGFRFTEDGLVFVSLNYRLGVFGFLDLSVIGGPAEAHSNGLTDQLAAIQWVAANIEAFGGDPANITLMGNSAGSMDISWHLASGRLPEGVRRVVMSSGVASAAGLGRGDNGSSHQPAEGRRRAAEFLANMGYTSFSQLQVASTDEILTRQSALPSSAAGLPGTDTLFYPRVGAYSALDPFDAAAAGMMRGREIILGFTAFEMGLWLLWDDDFDKRTPEWAAADQVPDVPETVRDTLPELYRRWLPTETDGRRAMHMVGDAVFVMPTFWFADLLAQNGATVFTYRFDWQVDDRMGALHAADLPFLFGCQNSASGEALIGRAENDRDRAGRDRISAAMRGAILGFARSEVPEVEGRLWTAYTTDRRTTLLFDIVSVEAEDPVAERRCWWTRTVLPAALGGGRRTAEDHWQAAP